MIKVEKKRRKKDWFIIYLNDGRNFLCHIDFMIKFGIKRGGILSDERIDEIKSLSEIYLAREIAFRFVAYKVRTEREVYNRLKREGFNEDVIQVVMDDLKRFKFLDDLEYAKNFAQSKLSSPSFGRRFIEQALKSRGVDDETISSALSEVFNDVDEFELAYCVAMRKLKQLRSSRRKIDEGKQRRKIYEFLARRGFDWDVIDKVLDKIFDDAYI